MQHKYIDRKLHACVYLCMCVCVFTYMYVRTYTYVCMYVNIIRNKHAYVRVKMNPRLHLCMHIFKYVCMYASLRVTYAHQCSKTHVWDTHTYTYMHTKRVHLKDESGFTASEVAERWRQRPHEIRSVCMCVCVLFMYLDACMYLYVCMYVCMHEGTCGP